MYYEQTYYERCSSGAFSSMSLLTLCMCVFLLFLEPMWRNTCWRNPVWSTRSIMRGERRQQDVEIHTHTHQLFIRLMKSFLEKLDNFVTCTSDRFIVN